MDSPNLDASVVQRAAPGAFWEGLGVEAKCDQVRKNFVFFAFFLLGGFFPFFDRFFVFPPLLLFLDVSGGHFSLSSVPPTEPPPTKLHRRVAHIPPPPSCTFSDCPAHRQPPEIVCAPPPHPSFCCPLGPISKACSTTACSSVGAGMSKVPP